MSPKSHERRQGHCVLQQDDVHKTATSFHRTKAIRRDDAEKKKTLLKREVVISIAKLNLIKGIRLDIKQCAQFS